MPSSLSNGAATKGSNLNGQKLVIFGASGLSFKFKPLRLMQFIDTPVAYFQCLHALCCFCHLYETGVWMFLCRGGSKYHGPQQVGDNKPGSDSEMANLSNRRLLLARIAASMQADVVCGRKAT